MILSDRELRAEIESGRLVIEPFDETALQPSSIDLRVGNQFRVFVNHRYPHIDVRQPLDQLTELVEATEEEPFMLHPGEFVLGTTLESVTLPDNLVARLEGKSSLGRLGLLIHSSLPGDEPVLLLKDGRLTQIPIGEVVKERLRGCVVSFDQANFKVDYHEITGWHETPPDRIFEVVLASGRSVCLTGGHALFTLDEDGEIAKVRVHELRPGSRVAVPGMIPDPDNSETRLDLLELAPESDWPALVCGGPSVAGAFQSRSEEIARLLKDAGIDHARYYQDRGQLPLRVALLDTEIVAGLRNEGWLAVRGGKHRLPMMIEVDRELAWLLGLYVAEGYRRANQITVSNTDRSILDRAQAVIERFGIVGYRGSGWLTFCSGMLSLVVEWLGMGGYAPKKRVPKPLLGWPRELLESFYEGFVDGDGSREQTRVSLWTSSDELVGDLLLLCSRLGRRAGGSFREREGAGLWQISVPHREHKLLTSVPNCTRLLIRIRKEAGLTQKAAAHLAGFKYNSQLNNIERGRMEAVRLATLRRLQTAYQDSPPASMTKLDRLVDGDLRWDRVREVRDTDRVERVFDLEVRPWGRNVQNFVAGRGGVLVSNTAGFVDAGFSGQLTLELSNVANLPIAIYPGMRVGQLCLFQMTSPAERPYGSKDVGSKYQGQTGPTPSRYYENFEGE